MPIYEWECAKCSEGQRPVRVDVFRPMDDRNLAPGFSCPRCGESHWERTITSHLRPTGEDHNRPFPLRVSMGQQPKRDQHGEIVTAVYTEPSTGRRFRAPVMEQVVETYDSVGALRAGAAKYGLVLHVDGMDPTVGRSQHSTFSEDPDPAPSERAVDMLKQGRFIGPDEISDYIPLQDLTGGTNA